MKTEPSKQTIFHVFEGKATPLQRTLVEEWLSDAEHQELYFQWLEEWERSHPQFLPDTDAAYALSLQKRTQEPAVSFQATIHPLNQHRYFYWWAAAVLLLLTAAGIYRFQDALYFERYSTGYGEVRPLTLADGSRVTLNANTTLKVPRFFFKYGNRQVWLRGEAEFAVQHTQDDRRFTVRTPGLLEVQVLGTEFSVYSRSRENRVFLHKGRVQVRVLDRQKTAPFQIAPGDLVTVSNQGQVSLRHHQSVNTHIAWKDHRFVFENTPVSEIAQQLNEQFGVRIVVADSALARRTLGGTFRAENADELLGILRDLLNIQIDRPESPPKTYELKPSY